MKYEITTTEEELVKYYYLVDANSPEEAEENIPWGNYEYWKFISGEVIDTEVKEVNDG